MSYNNSVYKKIYDEYSQKYLIAREKADERAREVRAKIPEIAKIDKELSLVILFFIKFLNIFFLLKYNCL